MISPSTAGYTKEARTELFQQKVAPVQISYLGYPGTLGAEFIDYVVADSMVIPSSHRHHYSENVIYMPNSYQPNDDARQISTVECTRAEDRLIMFDFAVLIRVTKLALESSPFGCVLCKP